MNTNRIRYALVAVALAMSLGCGKSDSPFDRAEASGTVTLDGKPLDEGVIYFSPIGGTNGPKAFATVKEGKFSSTGEYAPLVGQHRIEIISSDDGGIAFDDEEAMARWIAEGKKPLNRVIVPPIYNKQSILTADVTAEGPNEFKFELSSKRRR